MAARHLVASIETRHGRPERHFGTYIPTKPPLAPSIFRVAGKLGDPQDAYPSILTGASTKEELTSDRQFQPYHQSQGQTLAEALQQVSTSVTVSIPTSGPDSGPVTTCISVSIPAPLPLPLPAFISSSPSVAVAVSVTTAPPLAWQPPMLEEFLADVESRRGQRVLYHCNDIISATNFRAEIGQEDAPAELVEARNMALATQGLFKDCTPTMAWNYHFGDMEALYTERFAQVAAQNALVEPQHVSGRRPKRAAAAAASEAWKSLGPRKRRRGG